MGAPKGNKFAKGNPGNRNTKYTPELCDKLIDFFTEEPYDDIEIPHYGKDGELKWIDKKRMPRKLPTLVQFAKQNNISVSVIFDWIDPKNSVYHKEFDETLKKAKELQKDWLIQNGLQGLYNSIFAKFVAINITDMVDKVETDITSKGEKIGYDESQINKIAERISNSGGKDSNGGTPSTEASN